MRENLGYRDIKGIMGSTEHDPREISFLRSAGMERPSISLSISLYIQFGCIINTLSA